MPVFECQWISNIRSTSGRVSTINTASDTLLFYQGETVLTVLGSGRHHTLIKNASMLRAKLNISRETRRLSLLASNIGFVD